ncbi:TNF receptor-associated factor 6-like isoform X1 [Oculina patagonica]
MEVVVGPDYSSESSGSDEEEFEDGFEIDFIVDDFVDQSSDEEVIQPRFGGYDYEFVDEVSENQKCPVCLLPMRDAVQTTECGHRFCKDCLYGILRNNHPVCPNDRREIRKEGGYYPDKAWARDILGLRIKCKQNATGCDWIGELRHAEDHKNGCPYEDEECLACGGSIQRRLLEKHHDEECPKRIIECEHCQDEFTFVQKQEHESNYCRRFPLECANNCGKKGIAREEMESHLSEKCPMTEVICPYAEAGCPFQDKRCYLNDHIEASIDGHLELTWSSLDATKQELESMKDLRQKFNEVLEVNQKLTETVTDCHGQVQNLSLAVKSLQDVNVQQQKQAAIMAKKMSRERERVDNTLNKFKAYISSLRYEKVTRNGTSKYDRKNSANADYVSNFTPVGEWRRRRASDRSLGKETNLNCWGRPKYAEWGHEENSSLGREERKVEEDRSWGREEDSSWAGKGSCQEADRYWGREDDISWGGKECLQEAERCWGREEDISWGGKECSQEADRCLGREEDFSGGEYLWETPIVLSDSSD